MVFFILIFFVMIIAVGASAVVGFSLYVKRRNKRLRAENAKQFDEPPAYKSLFEPSDDEIRNFEREEQTRRETEDAERHRHTLLSRAAANDLSALTDCADDRNLYDEVLKTLSGAANSGEQISALAKFILDNKLRSGAEFVRKFGAVWNSNFDKKLTLDYLELAARSEKAEIYLNTLETTAKARRENFVTGFTVEDFASVAEADFWLLPDDERASGAGFSIKEKLAELRRNEF